MVGPLVAVVTAGRGRRILAGSVGAIALCAASNQRCRGFRDNMNNQVVKINYSGKALQEQELENHFIAKNMKKILKEQIKS